MPFNSAVLRLAGDREIASARGATHSNMCRFDKDNRVDNQDYEALLDCMKAMCEKAIRGEAS